MTPRSGTCDANCTIDWDGTSTRAVVALIMLTVLGMVFSIPAAQASDRVYYFHNDHLGTPQALSDAAGRIVWTVEYDPFGKATVNQDPDGDGQIVINNLRLPGQYYDAETGLHYNWNRYYDPGTGRYLQPDPIGLAGGLNLYSYVMNDPISLTDPTGENPVMILIAIAGAIGGTWLSSSDANAPISPGDELVPPQPWYEAGIEAAGGAAGALCGGNPAKDGWHWGKLGYHSIGKTVVSKNLGNDYAAGRYLHLNLGDKHFILKAKKILQQIYYRKYLE